MPNRADDADNWFDRLVLSQQGVTRSPSAPGQARHAGGAGQPDVAPDDVAADPGLLADGGWKQLRPDDPFPELRLPDPGHFHGVGTGSPPRPPYRSPQPARPRPGDGPRPADGPGAADRRGAADGWMAAAQNEPVGVSLDGPGAVPGEPWENGPPPTRGGRLARLAGKVGWNLTDQVLSTLTNAVLGVLVAHYADADGAGAFSIAFLLFALAIALQRALAGQVLTIRHASATAEEWPRIASRAFGAVTVLAVPAGLLIAVAGLLLGGVVRWPLVAVGVTLAPMLLQDTIRSVFFAQSRAQFAALNDAIWAVVQFTIMGILIAGGWAGVASLTFAWGISAAVCVVVGVVQLRAVPQPTAAASWVREHGDMLGYLLPETLITSGGDKAAYLGVGAILSEAAVGAVGYAQRVLSPLLIISQTTASFSMPEIARRLHLPPRTRWLLGLALGGVQGLISLAYLAVVLLIPRSVGTLVFPSTWDGARAVLLPMGLYSTVAGLCMGPFLVIAAMGHVKRTFRVTVLQTVLMVVLMPLGAVLGGVSGAAWGLVIGKCIEFPFWLLTLRTAAQLGPARHDDGGDPGPDPARTSGAVA